MKRYDHPADRVDPYPPAGAQVRRFRYESGLVLLRLKDAVRLRTGEDADFIVGRDFAVSWEDGDGVRHPIRVPAGLITDLTSVPRLWRWIVGRVGPWLEAAIVHDYLYIAWQDVPGRNPTRADRRFADDIMLAAMVAAKVNPIRARLIYWTVTVFGGSSFVQRDRDRYIDVCDPAVTEQLVSPPERARSGAEEGVT